MALSLLGKTALVTGSTSGLGLAIAKAFARQGANIVMNGFGDKDSAIQEVIKFASPVAEPIVHFGDADMSNPTAIERMVEEASNRFGGIDIVVNNAGIQHVCALDDFPAERWDAIMAINLSACFHTTRLTLPHMKRNNWGRIINVASTHGLVGSVGKSAYVAAKHGVVGLTKVTALELAKTNITANAICPGWVLTPLVQKQIEARAIAHNCSVEVCDIRGLIFRKLVLYTVVVIFHI